MGVDDKQCEQKGKRSLHWAPEPDYYSLKFENGTR